MEKLVRIAHSRIEPAANVLNAISQTLLFAGFRVISNSSDSMTISNEWYSLRITPNTKFVGTGYNCTVTKRGNTLIKDAGLREAIDFMLQRIDYGSHYVYVAGKAICPLQKFGDYNSEDKLLVLFEMLSQGQAELQFKSEKAFRWRLSNGHELTIKQSSTVETNEEPTMDIFSLISADQLFEVRVQFSNSSQAYSYKSEVAYEAGDKVVVDTPSNGLQVVTVVDSSRGLKGGNFPQYKWVVAKVYTARYEELVANEANAKARISAAQRADKVRKELEALGVTQDEVMAMLGLASKTDSQ